MEEIRTLEQAVAWCVEHEVIVTFEGGTVMVRELNGSWLGQAPTFLEAVDAAAMEWYDQSQQMFDEIEMEARHGHPNT